MKRENNMRIVRDLEEIEQPFPGAVITIGNFDGVHIGHQALFHEVIERADAVGGTSLAMTFEPHPIRVLQKSGHPPLITLFDQKAELVAETGMDVLICIPFTMAFAAVSAQQFVHEILVERIGMKAIVVGKDYTFGHRREGNLELLQTFADRLGFELVVADWIQPPNNGADRTSSTRIRELVQDGQMTDARKMLGRYYQIKGTVTHGRDRGGKLLGCPTANIKLYDELSPKTGVYAVSVEVSGRKYMGVANIGYSPTFDDQLFTVEVHLLDFDQEIYDRKIRVNFIERLRDEVKFDSIEALSDQIRADITSARQLLNQKM